MSESSFSWDRPARLLSDLCRMVAERAPAEREIPARLNARNRAAEEGYQRAQLQLAQEYEQAREATEAECGKVRRRAMRRSDADRHAAEERHEEFRADLVRRYEDAEWSVEHRWKTARWEANTVFEATKDQPFLQLKEIESQLEAGWTELQAIHAQAVQVLKRRRQWREPSQPEPEPVPAGDDPLRRFADCRTEARALLGQLETQAAAAWFEGARPAALFLLVWLAAVLPSLVTLAWSFWLWLPISLAASAGAGTVVIVRLHRIARRQTEEVYAAMLRALARAAPARQAALAAAREECDRRHQENVQRLRDGLERADRAYESSSAELAATKRQEFAQLDEEHRRRLAEIAAQRQRELAAIDRTLTRKLQDAEEKYRQESGRLAEEHACEMAQSKAGYQREWDAMADRWYGGMARFHFLVEQMNMACDYWFPDWCDGDCDRRLPPAGEPPPIRFGEYVVDLAKMDGGMPADDRLRPTRTGYRLPALLPFPDLSLLLLTATGAGRQAAVDLLRATMLRMLVSLPPGKVRFTILDPVGLGENFAAFMHLADYDEQLVTSRIWTEPAHIERRLADLTEHMENVLQGYLRNEFRSIQEYNAEAGEMAEPTRVLVVAGFPANFSETAARRLASIVASGARCGVYTLMSLDPELPPPREFRPADLEPHALRLGWDGSRFLWEHPDSGPMPLWLDPLPPPERVTAIVRAAGRRAQEAGRVEVPFSCVAPEESTWWSGDSGPGIDVPLGRIGAAKSQRLRLGKGTSQHVLVAGKTGSGKSTLLHVLVTSLAMHYSPEEVELYLVDFKKGVEFKAYARNRLPHARVIAIESEREFGLSVLERLDAELRTRGDLFRDRGVQDLPAFRAAAPGRPLPRVLLVVDEFQELFVEDDRLAQRAALILDRLVRQGRAFGIHVLLGSQTLAGNYSLPRSTLGQMAVRIALQCSEADAHLILSEENTAARLLTRPGEAIYNDANGLYEGNHPFQVVWLSDAEREHCLEQIGALASKRPSDVPPPIVFEGNADAELAENSGFMDLLDAPAPESVSMSPIAWLGAPVAIQGPTAVSLPRQSGSNLLVVGHREEAAAGVLAAAMASLAVQHPPLQSNNGTPATTFYLLDGSRRDAAEVGYWGRLAAALPCETRTFAPREAGTALAEIAARLAEREQAGRGDEPGVYLVVYNLARFPDLRKSDDDFGYGRLSDDQPPSPARLFAKILRDGPAFGVHTLLWCDTYHNVSRWLDRQGLHDLELRVLLQMNQTDSSQLIDSPAAGLLGPHRAILYHGGLGQCEKFRPYGVPSEEWLTNLRERLRCRWARETSVSAAEASLTRPDAGGRTG